MSKNVYLTVQDLLWINLQATGRPVPYEFAPLEDAAYCQYAYGSSKDIPAQAARFLREFASRKPFESGNTATAFVGFAAFLALNGFDLSLSDGEAAAWLAAALHQPDSVERLVGEATHAHDSHGHDEGHSLSVKSAAHAVFARFPSTVKTLVEEEAPVGLR